jgi:hypothetical protein
MYGVATMWTGDRKAEDALMWVNSTILRAQGFGMDVGLHVHNNMDKEGQTWLKQTLATKSYHAWAGDDQQWKKLRWAFKARYAPVLKDDKAKALEILTGGY